MVRSIVTTSIKLNKRLIGTKLPEGEAGILRQKKLLRSLLNKARKTEFGKTFNFEGILSSANVVKEFSNTVPVFTYEKILNGWWSRMLEGKENVSWPGKTYCFALTSGTSADTSKRVPVSAEGLSSMIKVGRRQLFTLANHELPKKFYKTDVLMLGGATEFVKQAQHQEADLSGILVGKLPFWFGDFYKPGADIAKERSWDKKLERIVKEARNWDIGIIAGVPTWVQLLIEKIIEFYDVKHIHEIWPNLNIYAHGGVSFEPYKGTFEKLLGHPIIYQETYLASEGFFAYEDGLVKDLKLVLDCGTYFEFIPFNRDNFDTEGNLMENAKVLSLSEVQENKPYAILITNNSGAWRYLIGDVIEFKDLEIYTIRIVGRTKHFLSLCGEHLSVDNMNQAIQALNKKFPLGIKEFTVIGEPKNNKFQHRWYIGVDNQETLDQFKGNETIATELDNLLKELNDDYAVERKAILKEIKLSLLLNSTFYDYMRKEGRMGGQYKFPRVLDASKSIKWKSFLKTLGE